MTLTANFLARACLWLGMLLPLFTLGYEGYTHACSGTFFDPLPTVWHVVALLPVPVACFLTWRVWKNPSEEALKRLGIVTRIAWPAMLLYGVAFARVSLMACLMIPMSLVAIGSLGIGIFLLVVASLGPLAGLVGLSVATGSLARLRATLPEPVAARHRRLGKYGWLAGIALLVVAEGPLLWTEFWLQGAADRRHALQVQSLQMLRATGRHESILRLCYETRQDAVFGPSLALLMGREGVPFSFRRFISPVGFNRAREIYFQVTGLPFNEVPPPRANQSILLGLGPGVRRDHSLDDVVWDGERGGDAVGARIRGLTLAHSSMNWQLDSPSALAYGEWTLEFHNRHANAQEARCQILLPPNGFVSRVNLWIDGQPQEAAFGARAKVKAAYRQVVVVEERDPVMVNMSGPDRVAVQCFPVPSGGTMKIRLGITAPCDEGASSRLALPVFVERNFGIGSGFKHQLTSKRDTGGPEQREISDEALLRDRVPAAEVPASLVWTEDPFAGGKGHEKPRYLVRRREPVAQAPAKRVVAVVDGSFRLRDHAGVIREALQSVPSKLKLEVVMATDREPLTFDREALPAQITARAFAGGRDNAPALLQALKLAAKNEPGQEPATILWLHGPQPWDFGWEDLLPPSREDGDDSRAVPIQSSRRQPNELGTYIASLPNPPAIHAIELATGPNRLLEQLYQTTELRCGTRWDGTGDGLKGLLASLVGGGERWQYPCIRTETPPQEGTRVWDHLVRQHVYQEVLGAFKGVNVVPETLAQTAAHYQLVTPYSGAVVLETKQQYANAGLDPVDPNSSPKIPNVVPEPSRALLLVFALAWALSRRRRMPA